MSRSNPDCNALGYIMQLSHAKVGELVVGEVQGERERDKRVS